MKKIIVLVSVFLFGILIIYANSIDLKFNEVDIQKVDAKNMAVLSSFNENYKLTYKMSEIDSNIENEIIEITKKLNYLHLSNENEKESTEEYYKRLKKYYSYFHDDAIYFATFFEGFSSVTCPNMSSEIEMSYGGDDTIRVSNIISNCYEKTLDGNIPTSVEITYIFKKQNGEYKVYITMGASWWSIKDINEYFLKFNENKIVSILDFKNENLYDYSELEKLSDEKVLQIYDKYKNSIVGIQGYYNSEIVKEGHGFFIESGLIVTTWNFLRETLLKAQSISIFGYDGKYYDIDGVVTINPDSDIAIIKLKEQVGSKAILGKSEDLKLETPIMNLMFRNGSNPVIQKGIVIDTNGYMNMISTAATQGFIINNLPLTASDEGTILLNTNGEIVGMNTNRVVNNLFSKAINSSALKEVQDKFSKISFNQIETISFKNLKDKYYYVILDDELKENNLSEADWNYYSKIGNLSDNLLLDLVKVNKVDNAVSFRYRVNNLYNMEFDETLLFENELIKQGYKKMLNNSVQKIYENNINKVVIYKELDYVIIVMVKK